MQFVSITDNLHEICQNRFSGNDKKEKKEKKKKKKKTEKTKKKKKKQTNKKKKHSVCHLLKILPRLIRVNRWHANLPFPVPSNIKCPV